MEIAITHSQLWQVMIKGKAWDNLSCEWHQGRERGRIGRGQTNHKYAAQSQLIEHWAIR